MNCLRLAGTALSANQGCGDLAGRHGLPARRSTSTALLNSVPRLNHGLLLLRRFAARLVELFPTKIRYTSMSLPYHIGNGWFGGLLPATAFAIVASTGDIHAGLWYPIIFASITAVVGFFFLPETKDVDIKTN